MLFSWHKWKTGEDPRLKLISIIHKSRSSNTRTHRVSFISYRPGKFCHWMFCIQRSLDFIQSWKKNQRHRTLLETNQTVILFPCSQTKFSIKLYIYNYTPRTLVGLFPDWRILVCKLLFCKEIAVSPASSFSCSKSIH